MKNYKLTYFDKVFLRRIIAALLDALICFFLASIVWIMANIIGFFTFGIIKKAIPFILPVILTTYYVYSLGSTKGITFGMSYMKIDFLNNKNQNLEVKELLIYNILFFLVIPIGTLFLISIIFPLSNNQRRCLQDYIFKTKFILTD
ncbi:RDD family protein [Hyphomicrobiales bacterium]|nr:RDD family protein [Hyphomicrobiales bacterium]MDG1152268.1 RDD family protein [Hyphomicrobiales bacterium]MDG1523683.1 RDD family protein [Hyphomicrobiales bacterium]MDG1665295.1 RDD family protein [Hyphomicrobiales bacterium]MDG2413151.1 RDD family protein [Hyphomicrobiales bacterium]